MVYPPIIQHPVSAIRETLRSDPTRSHTRWHDSIDGGSRIPHQPDLATTAPTPPSRLWKMYQYVRKPEGSDSHWGIRNTFTGKAPKREGATSLKVDAQNSQTQPTVLRAAESRHLNLPPSIISPPYYVGTKTNAENDHVMSSKRFRNKGSVLKGSVYSDPTYTHSSLHDHYHDTQRAFKARDRLDPVVAPETKHLGDATASESSDKRDGKLQDRVGDSGKYSSNKMGEGSVKVRRKPSPRAADISDNITARLKDAYIVTAGRTSPSRRRDTPGELPYQRNQNVFREQSTGDSASECKEERAERNLSVVMSRSVHNRNGHKEANDGAASSSLSGEDVSDYEPDPTSSSALEEHETTSDLEAREIEKNVRSTSNRARGITRRRHKPTGKPSGNLQDGGRMVTRSHTESLSPSEPEASTPSPSSEPQSDRAAEEDAARLRQKEEDRLLAIQIAKGDYNLRRPRQQTVRRGEEPTQEGSRGGRGSRRRRG